MEINPIACHVCVWSSCVLCWAWRQQQHVLLKLMSLMRYVVHGCRLLPNTITHFTLLFCAFLSSALAVCLMCPYRFETVDIRRHQEVDAKHEKDRSNEHCRLSAGKCECAPISATTIFFFSSFFSALVLHEYSFDSRIKRTAWSAENLFRNVFINLYTKHTEHRKHQ